jgi:pimeloyl-ACP methyl ester carboxylesterase
MTTRFSVSPWRFALYLVGPAILVAAWHLFRSPEATGHEPEEKAVAFTCSVADLAGSLTTPDADDLPKPRPGQPTPRIPCVVIVGGTLSHTRDGELTRPGVPKRTALAKLAHTLAHKGYASLRYDKVDYGASKAKPGWKGSYRDEAKVAAAAIAYVRGRQDLGPVIVAGESAGGYLACLAAKDGTQADAYLFLGAHCGPGEAIYEYNFGRLVAYADGSPERRMWVEKDLRHELALGRNYKVMFEAARKGRSEFELVDGDYKKTIDVRRRAEELTLPPDEMFRHIQVPALALGGERDLNVAPDHAAKIVSILRKNGNHACTCVVIPGVDHNFQKTPEDKD